ncbi:MAG: hypothetical protein ABSF26_19950 [Thermoguttaceae bacterium]|jgi:hypothetical protein
MHARELVELAAILSSHAAVLIRGTHRLSASGIQQYWTASKCRLDRWARSLKTLAAEAPPRDATALAVRWPTVRGALEEILTGEVLTRVWAAVLTLYDRQRGTQDAEAVGRSIMIGHLEARHRVLMLLVHNPGIDTEGAVKLNCLRRRAERWTDVLVGYLGGLGEVGPFAADADRARDFYADLQAQCRHSGSQQVWPIMLGSLRAAFRQGLMPVSPNADLNASIASAILSCFPAEVFDSTGLFRSLWLVRLSNVTDDVAGMIDNLLRPEPPSGASAGGAAGPQINRLRRFGQ